MKRFLLLFSLFLTVVVAGAQVSIQGVVVDSATLKKLSGVSVILQRGGKPLKFTRTDQAGHFAINLSERQEGDVIQTSLIGYKKQKTPIPSTKQIVIKMAPSTFVLKEVQVQGGRIFGKQDTITYDLTRFVTERDNSLKDILKRLPGVDIAKNGQINYNGKPINRFTVEGLDLTGGRYDRLNENIKAQDVKKAEIIEHDQPVKALQNKVFTDDVAMNIGLKDEARDKLLPTLKPYFMVGKPTGGGGEANVMQIGKARQLMYDAVYDRTGRDLSQSSRQLAISLLGSDAVSLPAWLAVPGLSSPIDAARLRFNTSQKYGFNRVSKGSKGGEFRISADYQRAVIRQQTDNISHYYLEGQQPVETRQTQELLLKNDDFIVEMEQTVNTEKTYGNIKFNINASQKDALSTLQDSRDQHIRVPSVNISNRIHMVKVFDRTTLTLNSTVDYHHSQSALYVGDGKNKLNTNLWHTENDATFLFKQRNFTHRYGGGFMLENLSVTASNPHLSLYVEPYWQYGREPLTLRLSVKASFERFTRQQKSYLLLNPRFTINLKGGNRHAWYASTYFINDVGGWQQFALDSCRRDYRTTLFSAGIIPETKSLGVSIRYDYKRPIKELFWNTAINIRRSWYNTLTDLQIQDGFYRYFLQESHNHSQSLYAETILSKGFFDLNLKTKLGASFVYSQGEQLSAGRMLDFRSQVYRLEPNIEYSPAWCAVSYVGSFSWYRSYAAFTDLSTLFNWLQTLSLTATVANTDLSFAWVHYHNELQSGSKINTLLADVTAVWRRKRLRLSAQLRNLFNKHTYALTAYSGVGTLTDRYRLRPREFLLTAQYSF